MVIALIIIAWLLCGVLGCYLLSYMNEVPLGIFVFFSLLGLVTVAVAVIAWLIDGGGMDTIVFEKRGKNRW